MPDTIEWVFQMPDTTEVMFPDNDIKSENQVGKYSHLLEGDILIGISSVIVDDI